MVDESSSRRTREALVSDLSVALTLVEAAIWAHRMEHGRFPEYAGVTIVDGEATPWVGDEPSEECWHAGVLNSLKPAKACRAESGHCPTCSAPMRDRVVDRRAIRSGKGLTYDGIVMVCEADSAHAFEDRYTGQWNEVFADTAAGLFGRPRCSVVETHRKTGRPLRCHGRSEPGSDRCWLHRGTM